MPVGIQACIDKQCTDTIRAALTVQALAGLGAVISQLLEGGQGAEKIIEAISKTPWLSKGLTAMAAAARITPAQAVLVLLAFVVLLAYHAIAGQIALLEKQGKTANGVRLKHPLLVIIGAAALTAPTGVGPILTAQIGVHVPMIVTERWNRHPDN